MITVSMAELSGLVGADLGVSAWVDMDQVRVDAFAECTEDRQWIHTDLVRAAAGPFGGPIAHGYLTLSLTADFMFQLLRVEDAGVVVNYGLDRVRFPAPVLVGARVRGRGRLLEVVPVSGGLQTLTRITVETSAGGKPACVADTVTRFVG